VVDGKERSFRGYSGTRLPARVDDGTIAPTAAISSVVYTRASRFARFASGSATVPTVREMSGFADAFNQLFDTTSRRVGWFDRVAIDRERSCYESRTIVSGLSGKVMHKDRSLRRALVVLDSRVVGSVSLCLQTMRLNPVAISVNS